MNTIRGMIVTAMAAATAAMWPLQAQALLQATGGEVSVVDVGGTVYRVHVFTNSGPFSVGVVGNAEYLVVAGGGGGGGNSGFSQPRASGGGGAGGVLTNEGEPVAFASGSYTIVVGDGGDGNTNGTGTNGGNSSLIHESDTELEFVAVGGGGGGGRFNNGIQSPEQDGAAGGSGGGPGRLATGGAAESGQGHAGAVSSSDNAGGGGGGAGGIGANGVDGTGAGNGGIGIESFIRDPGGEYVAGGGGGAGTTDASRSTPNGDGGLGGGGAAGEDGAPNTGGGGGAGGVTGTAYSGSGGSGIVIIRYPAALDKPLIVNEPVSNITTTAATVFGYLASTGTYATTVGVLYGMDDASESGDWASTNWWAEGAWDEGDYPNTEITSLTPDRTYYYTFTATNSAGASVAPNPVAFITGAVTIQKDADAYENNFEAGAFSVQRPGLATNEALTVYYERNVASTAEVNVNYEPLSGQVVIPAGETNATITVTPLQDLDNSNDTSLILDLLSGDYVLDQDTSATMTIHAIQMPGAPTNVWLGAGNASDGANWSLGVPQSGHDILLGLYSTGDMTWDAGVNGLPDTVASWTQTVDYTGTVTVNTTYPSYSTTFTNLAITGNAVIENGIWTHQGHFSTQNSDATRRYRLRVTVGGDLTVAGAAKLDAFGRGLVNSGIAEVIRGTLGGQRSNETGWLPLLNRTTHGSITEPEDPGRGGDWGGSNTRYGGGAIWLEVGGAATIDGDILARAGTWSNTGITPRSGSGGSIFLRAGTLSGGGLIDASNGDAGSVGSGGRVAVIVTNSTSFGSVVLRAFGGGSGPAAAGTVYREHMGHGEGQGILILDNNNQNHSLYALPYHAYGVTLMPDAANGGPVDLGQFAEIIVTNRAVLGINTDTVLDWSTVNLSTYGRDQSFIAIRGTNSVTWPANFTVDGFTLLLDVDPEPTGDWTVAAGGRIARTFARQSNFGNQTVGYPLVPPLTLTLDGDLTVDAGGEITVQRMGYYSNSGPGLQSGNRASSHGGQGGSSDGTGGNPVYGSILFPATAGSGGKWGNQNFSTAGGRMRLTVTGTMMLNGELNAMPHASNQDRASGGSVWLTTGYLQGTTGVINARGRDGSLGGGGGRIAVYLTAGDDIGAVTLDARGGAHATNPGAAGTVYVQTASDGPGGGRIEIWNGSRVQYSRAATPIPPATALVSDVPATAPTYGAFTDDLTQTRWDLQARGRVLLQASQELVSVTIASDAVLDLNGHTLLLKGAVIDGASLGSGEHSATSLGLAQVVDSAGTDGRIVIPPPGSLFLMR